MAPHYIHWAAHLALFYLKQSLGIQNLLTAGFENRFHFLRDVLRKYSFIFPDAQMLITCWYSINSKVGYKARFTSILGFPVFDQRLMSPLPSVPHPISFLQIEYGISIVIANFKWALCYVMATPKKFAMCFPLEWTVVHRNDSFTLRSTLIFLL